VVLSVLGFSAWSLTALKFFHAIALNPVIHMNLDRCASMGKVVAAAGMIMLALEDELAINKAAQGREHRARRELEVYASLILSRRKLEDFDRQGGEICQSVVANSRFAQAALLLNTGGRYKLAGSAGLDGRDGDGAECAGGAHSGGRLSCSGSAPPAVEQSQTVNLDLGPWLSRATI